MLGLKCYMWPLNVMPIIMYLYVGRKWYTYI